LTIVAVRRFPYDSPWWCGRVIGRREPCLTIFTTCLPPIVWRQPLRSSSRIAARWSRSFAMVRPYRLGERKPSFVTHLSQVVISRVAGGYAPLTVEPPQAPWVRSGPNVDCVPLFICHVCHANCCRSVLASYLYRHLCAGAPVLSAGLEPGVQSSDRALAMLARWGIDARRHRPVKLDRELCNQARAVCDDPSVRTSAAARVRCRSGGQDSPLSNPFIRPGSLAPEKYTVTDPSFDERPIYELVEEYSRMRDHVQIREALLGRGRRLVAAASYLDLLEVVDPMGH